MSEKKNIAIIGAGFAGLAAAYRLCQSGYTNFDIYEARQRVGGRVLSARLLSPYAEATIELGGQNIADGGKAPKLRTLAKELGLTVLEDEIVITPAFYDHQTRQHTDLLQLQTEFSHRRDHSKLKETIEVIAERSATIADILFALFPDKGILYRSLTYKFWGFEGGHPSHISAQAWEDVYYMLCGGFAEAHTSNTIQYARIAGGNAMLAVAMAEKLEKHLHLGHPLKSIQMTEQNSILLSFKGGMQKEYDKIILAIPCAVYKDIEIDPRLIPAQQLAFIDKVPYGNHAKVFVPSAADMFRYSQLLADEMSAYFNKENSSWILYFAGHGDCSLQSLMPERHKKSLEMLKTIYPTLTASETFPQEAQDQSQFNSYHQPVTHFWRDNPYSQGSYSYRGRDIFSKTNVIEDYGQEKVRSPYAPINDRVFFAGEHTAVEAYFGTLEGAVESGERAARMAHTHLTDS